MSPPGQRIGPEPDKLETNPETACDVPFRNDKASVSQPDDTVRLRHGLTALYVRDTDPLSIAVRRMRRGRPMNPEQQQAYESWLAEQRQDAAS